LYKYKYYAPLSFPLISSIFVHWKAAKIDEVLPLSLKLMEGQGSEGRGMRVFRGII
jgi:hypothetical protein